MIYNQNMKFNKIIAYFFVFVSLFACSNEKHFTLNFDENDTSIAIISDTHYLSKDLLDSDINYDEINFVSDGRTIQYNTLLLDEMINKAIEEKVQYFIITGDLTFNGEKVSHIELASKLKKLHEHNIKPLVIPGNHDIYNFKARSYKEEIQNVDYITIEDFKEIYQDCGYSSYYSYDPDSLSYIVETQNNEWLIMLDTTLSRYNLDEGMVLTGGYFSSLDWLRENLQVAKEKNIECVVFSHHNLINHNPLFSTLYDLSNKDELISLYQEYQIKLHFSGHLHIQDIKEQDGIYDIATSSLVDYGNRYGLLKMNHEGKEYLSKELNFTLNDQSFSEYSENLFYQKGYNKFLSNYSYLGDDIAETLADYQARVNTIYFNGEIYENYNKLTREKAYSVAKEQLEDFSESYLNSMLEYGNNESCYLLVK